MALANTIQWEVRTAGSDTACSGGFNTAAGGTDYSQQDAAQYTGTNLVVDGTVNTKVTSATHNFVAADVGNIMQITAGASWTFGFYEIVSVAANAATLDRSPAAVGITGGTFAVGGALKSPGLASGTAVTQNTIWIKSGTYSITTTSSNVANGILTPATAVLVRGYGTTRGDDAARPVLQASGIATIAIVNGGTNDIFVWNVEVDGAGLTAIRGFVLSSANRSKAYFCVARNCTNNGYYYGMLLRCRATACTTQPAFNAQECQYCEADANTAGGFNNPGTNVLFGCLAYGNTTYGFNNSGGYSGWINCTAYNNTTAGFIFANPPNVLITNCVSYGNGTYGFDAGAAPIQYFEGMWNCAGGANTTADRRGPPPTWTDNFITLTADPFVNKAAGNFALNNNAGGGAALRALGLPGAFTAGTTTSYEDIGAAQHQDSGGGGTTTYIRQVAMRGGGG